MISKNSSFVICSSNPYKISEISSIMIPFGVKVSLGPKVDIPEDGKTFLENACIKAIGYSQLVDGYTIAEDSGICIDALNGLPGLHSARFTGCDINDRGFKILRVDENRLKGKTRETIDHDNIEFVMSLMDGVENRKAHFHIAMVVANPHGEIIFKSERQTDGYISDVPKGDNGFGYDAIFIGNDTFGMTYAELDSLRKNLRSHRKYVLQDLRTWLNNVIR